MIPYKTGKRLFKWPINIRKVLNIISYPGNAIMRYHSTSTRKAKIKRHPPYMSVRMENNQTSRIFGIIY